jgi:hypothetical protein
MVAFGAGLSGAVLGIFTAVVLIGGFAVVGVLFVWVVRKAPPDGSDVGMVPERPEDPPDAHD